MHHRKLPSIKKNIKKFLTSEEGNLTKKNALQLGMILGLIGVAIGNINMGQASCWKNHNSHSSHTNCGHTSCCTTVCHNSGTGGCVEYCPCNNNEDPDVCNTKKWIVQ